MQDNLSRLLNVANAEYVAQQEKMRAVLAEEAGLRRRIARLQEVAMQAKSDLTHPQSMQGIGADLLWQSWHDKTLRQLNHELAQVLARKQPFLERLKASFGRKSALEQMVQQDLTSRKKEASRRQQDQLLEQLVAESIVLTRKVRD